MGAIGLAAQVKPLRESMLKHIKAGDGPDAARRAKSWFRVDFVGEGGGQVVHARVSGGDPGYDETAKMLAESALSLAFDDNPPTAGQVTTAEAMGDALIERLQASRDPVRGPLTRQGTVTGTVIRPTFSSEPPW